MVGVCEDGTEFIFDIDDYDEIKKYSWTCHRGNIESYGGDCPGRTIARVIYPNTPKNQPIFRKSKTLDFRKENLKVRNVFTLKGDYYDVTTPSGAVFQIDVEDKEAVSQYRWLLTQQGYVATKMDGKYVYLHRFLMGVPIFVDYSEVVDHIDRNPLNNRKSNLRILSQGENARNRGLSSANTSGVTNVQWCKELSCWRAVKTYKGARHEIGLFIEKEDAVNAIAIFDECLSKGVPYSDMSTYQKRRSTSGYKYIYSHKPKGWTVRISGSSKKYLGLYYSLEEAIKVRDAYLASI